MLNINLEQGHAGEHGLGCPACLDSKNGRHFLPGERTLDAILRAVARVYPSALNEFTVYMEQYRYLVDQQRINKITTANINAWFRSVDFLEAEMYRLCPSVIPAGFPRVRAPLGLYSCKTCYTAYDKQPCPKCFPQKVNIITTPGAAASDWLRNLFLGDDKTVETCRNRFNNLSTDAFFDAPHMPIREEKTAQRAKENTQPTKCIYCSARVAADGKCQMWHMHTDLQMEDPAGCVGGIFCICQPGWGHKSPWRNMTASQLTALTLDSTNYTSPLEAMLPEPKYRGSAHYSFDVYKVIADIWGCARQVAKRRILKRAFGLTQCEEKCEEKCPACQKPCQKKYGHEGLGLGTGSLCWCEYCQSWWLKGETALLHKRKRP